MHNLMRGFAISFMASSIALFLFRDSMMLTVRSYFLFFITGVGLAFALDFVFNILFPRRHDSVIANEATDDSE